LTQLTAAPPRAFSFPPGDTVIQTGATSQVGQAVIQIAKSMGVKTYNIIRRSTEEVEAEQRRHLEALGADHVVVADDLRSDAFKAVVKELGAPMLALNCVSGKIGSQLQRVMGEGATCVTYGAMSRRPLDVGAASLIFRDLRFVGFWMTRWNKVGVTSWPGRGGWLA
jgi:trans-2-enoyl-CoA reductase